MTTTWEYKYLSAVSGPGAEVLRRSDGVTLLMHEVPARLTALDAEIDRLRKTLREIDTLLTGYQTEPWSGNRKDIVKMALYRARRALEGDE